MKETELNNGTVAKVRGIDANGNSIVTTPEKIAGSGGCGKYIPSNRVSQNKWYRIAIGSFGHVPNVALLMVGNYYNSEVPHSQLLYIHADGYSNAQSVVQLANSGKVISKVRILYKASTTVGPIVEIFVKTSITNQLILSYSCNINFVFQNMEEVSDIPEEGYSVKEFTF